jgi:hypothetical protein
VCHIFPLPPQIGCCAVYSTVQTDSTVPAASSKHKGPSDASGKLNTRGVESGGASISVGMHIILLFPHNPFKSSRAFFQCQTKKIPTKALAVLVFGCHLGTRYVPPLHRGF